MPNILSVRKGDIIVERINGKKIMTPVKQIEFFACSKKGVHVNQNSCYDNSATVTLVNREETASMPEEMTNEDIENELRKYLDKMQDELLLESISRLY